MVDEQGFRPGVGIIVANKEGHLLWARRIKQNAWQFPQGGLQPDENTEQALYRELYEEIGLTEEDVEQLGCTRSWLYYHLPERLLRHHIQPLCIGQKQKWYLLRLVGNEDQVRLNLSSSPEFDRWRWVDYWYPLKQVIAFKRHVYRRALEELAPLLPELTLRKRVKHEVAVVENVVESNKEDVATLLDV